MTHDPEETQHFPILAQGMSVKHYRIVERLGAGGMGEVYLADDTRLDRRVALKFLPPASADENRARFLREARAAARLHHPNIVSVHEVSEANGRPFIAMQYVAGPTLQHHCTVERLPIPDIIALAIPIARGLAKAHDAGIVHRDIKPANILLEDGSPVIVDFGLASVHGGESLTEIGSTFGTAPYMSPEQAQGQPADHRSDLFSLGVVLYELIAGNTPFHRDNIPATLHAIVHDEIPEPRHDTDLIPEELARILHKCLAKNRDERYASAHDLASDLQKLQGALATGSAPGIGSRDATPATVQSLPSIAVLPFDNMSSDPENEFFSDGLTEELLNVLAKNPSWKVSGRTSSFAFKGKKEDLREIGRKLGVEKILEGSVRKAGNRVRITAQLINVGDGFHLWSETYDRVLEDIFDVQDDIAGAVAETMNVTLLGPPSAQHVPDADTYALVLRAKQAALQISEASMKVAVDLYQRAVERDPKYAAAWAGLARAFTWSAGVGFADMAEYVKKGIEAADKALSLDPQLPDAQEARGLIAHQFEFRFAKAAEHFHKAYELAPNNSQVIMSLALHHGVLGEFDEMLRMANVALELDPLNPEAHLHLGRFLYWADRNAEAEDRLQRALELSPGMASVRGILAMVFVAQEKFDEAYAAMEAEPGEGYRHCGFAVLHHLTGRKAESDAAMAALLEFGDDWGFQIAIAYAMREQVDEAIEWLQRCIEFGDSGAAFSKVHPMLRPLHGDPRWEDLVRRLGLKR